MKKIEILSDFAFAHHGYERREYRTGEVVETDDPDLLEIAVREGWARPTDTPAEETAADDVPSAKAKKSAPENKARGGA